MSISKKQRGTVVYVQNDNVDKALRKFKKRILEQGKMQELRDREFYEKPTLARKKAANSARRRHLKRLADQSLPKKLF